MKKTTKAQNKTQKKSQNTTIYEMQAEICGALANPVRLHIIDLLSDQEKTSTALLEELHIPKANLSQHLSVLKDAGILKSRKEGLFIYFSLSIPKIKDACSLVKSVLIEKITNKEKENNLLMKKLKGSK